jgi:hypothetical protein
MQTNAATSPIGDLLAAIEGRPNNTNEFSKAMQAYIERFGYMPVGIGMPEVTIAMLQDAVSSGVEIVENTPEDATA